MFTLIKRSGRARRGVIHTGHGDVHTPAFMTVATQAAVKGGLSTRDIDRTGCQMALCNTYHLHLRPGEDIVRELGGLHGFMRRDGPILTDSGGFQVFSLASMRKIAEEGVTFASHIDGRRVSMRPEDSIRVQWALGADIAMAFDECVPNPSPYDYVEASVGRTTRWLARCRDEWLACRERGGGPTPGQALWGINQGGVYDDLRVRHMDEIAELDLPGYAIGGLAVGETPEEMYRVIEAVEPRMPERKPRYLMGVGTPTNIMQALKRGVDIFDCVMPARNARHGHLYTSEGRLNLNNEKYKADPRPVDASCACPLCRHGYSRAYIRHLFRAGEMLAMRLAVLHNLTFYNNLMSRIREAIEGGGYDGFCDTYSGVFDRRI
ncbi:MAG: tRNA guanosine(34) transglycosylase Tgt [Oscillospiraceae bacterium]|nr:tRNA guanosine(34) transglycosylase Tgt [Oscillospiraceae bacterium]